MRWVRRNRSPRRSRKSGKDTFGSSAGPGFQPSNWRKTESSSKSFRRRSTGSTPARDCRAFYWHALGRPDDQANLARARRFAGFYLNEDPAAPNYDPKLKIIKSLFNGSKGPITRPVTPVDWDGDENPERAARFSTSSNIRGDHPLNLLATTLSTQAYLLTHEPKYQQWVLEYVDAWRDRAAANGGNFPSNIGLDGQIGGEWEGKWYGGVFGWNSPDDGRRNYVLRGIPSAHSARRPC